MKKSLPLIFFSMFCIMLSADDYDKYLKQAYEHLNTGRTELAERNYNVYKELSGRSDAQFERKLSDKKKGTSDTPEFPITCLNTPGTFYCDGTYPGPYWYDEFKQHKEHYHRMMSSAFNKKHFLLECSFLTSESVRQPLLSFDTSYRKLTIFLDNEMIVIDTEYGDYIYETSCRYKLDAWNKLGLLFNDGQVSLTCNGYMDILNVFIDYNDWSVYSLSSIYWGTSRVFKGYLKDVVVKTV